MGSVDNKPQSYNIDVYYIMVYLWSMLYATAVGSLVKSVSGCKQSTVLLVRPQSREDTRW